MIVTANLDAATFARVDGLRRRHFPAALNLIPAHLTLFHRLEGDVRAVLLHAERAILFDLCFTGVRMLGRGVALSVESPALMRIRSNIADAFADRLTPQDRQGFRPHVTIQNKVAPDVARTLCESLSADFQPFAGVCQGLLLWRYLGGPWDLEAEFPFKG